jgi:threonine aldolase
MIIRDLWFKRGCPEKMKIHVKSTGEEIQVLDGLPVTLSPETNALFVRTSEARKRQLRQGQPVTLTRTCEACKREFQARRNTSRFCSARCRVALNRTKELSRRQAETAELLAAV